MPKDKKKKKKNRTTRGREEKIKKNHPVYNFCKKI